MSWLKDLFGGAPKPASKKKAAAQKAPGRKSPTQKTYAPTGNRAAIIAEAMAVYHRERAHAQGVLERAFQEMQAKPPRPSDIEGMTRMLTLRNAILALKGHMAHDLKRYQVLVGVKGLLESPGKTQSDASGAAPGPKGGGGKPPSQGAKR